MEDVVIPGIPEMSEPPEDVAEPVLPTPAPSRPAPVSTAARLAPEPAKAPAPDKPKEVKQEVLQFEPVSRGRFEKSEPTIVEGHDLDVPTVLRKGFRV
jgi:cell division protein FtsZ